MIGDYPRYTDISSENSLLSAIYKYNIEAMIQTEDFGLMPNDFYYDTNQKLFYIMNSILKENPKAKLDKPSITAKAKSLGLDTFIKKEESSGLIDKISVIPVNNESVGILTESIKRNSVFRKVIDDVNSLSEKIENKIDESASLEDLLYLIETNSASLTEAISNPNAKIIKMSDGYGEWLKERIENPRDLVGIPTGFPKYDFAIGGGLRRQSINLVGARPKTGKSFIALNVGYNVAMRGIPVLYLDTELTKEHQMPRFSALDSQVPIDEIETGRVKNNPDYLNALRASVKRVGDLPLCHQYIGGWKFEQVAAFIKTWISKFVGFDGHGNSNDCVIVYDYLKVLRDDEVGKMQEYQKIGFWITQLQDICVRQDVAMFMLIQLNRDGIDQDNSSVISQSDRVLWNVGSFSILKDKSKDEMLDSGKYGNQKLIINDSRFGRGTPDSYINISSNLSIAKMQEGMTKEDAYRDSKND